MKIDFSYVIVFPFVTMLSALKLTTSDRQVASLLRYHDLSFTANMKRL